MEETRTNGVREKEPRREDVRQEVRTFRIDLCCSLQASARVSCST